MAFETALKVDKKTTTLNSDGRLVKTYHRQHLSKSDTALTNDEVEALIGVLPGAPHPTWPFATCRTIHTERQMTTEPHCAWLTDYDYSTEATAPNDEATASTDPTVRRVKRRTGHLEQQRFIVKDKNDVMIVDAAGSPFDGGVPVTDYLGTMTFERDEIHNAGSMSQAAQLTGKTNSDVFMGCAIGTLMLKVTGEEKWEGSYHFWTFVYDMTYDAEGWNPKPANAGLYQKVAGVRTRILEDGKPTQEPQPLYSTIGTVIPVANRPAACNFITVDHCRTLSYASLGLPTT